MARGLRVGLGTDIAGGAEAGLLPVCAHAVDMSRLLQDGVDQRLSPSDRGVADSAIDVTTAFWLATVGGAEVLGIPAGRLEVGHVFDAIAVSTRPAGEPGMGVPVWDLDDWARVFEKIVRLANPMDITDVWVNGTSVKSKRAAA